MNLDNFDNYTVFFKGIEAFEQHYVNTEVVFERMDGTFLTYNQDPFEVWESPFKEGLPQNISIEYITEQYFPLVELAEQLGFKNAWGMEH